MLIHGITMIYHGWKSNMPVNVLIEMEVYCWETHVYSMEESSSHGAHDRRVTRAHPQMA